MIKQTNRLRDHRCAQSTHGDEICLRLMATPHLTHSWYVPVAASPSVRLWFRPWAPAQCARPESASRPRGVSGSRARPPQIPDELRLPRLRTGAEGLIRAAPTVGEYQPLRHTSSRSLPASSSPRAGARPTLLPSESSDLGLGPS